jgi:hypothetical protein
MVKTSLLLFWEPTIRTFKQTTIIYPFTKGFRQHYHYIVLENNGLLKATLKYKFSDSKSKFGGIFRERQYNILSKLL